MTGYLAVVVGWAELYEPVDEELANIIVDGKIVAESSRKSLALASKASSLVDWIGTGTVGISGMALDDGSGR